MWEVSELGGVEHDEGCDRDRTLQRVFMKG
jgi:hypothetical protein